MGLRPEYCYLCCRPLSDPVSVDHVPPRQLFPKQLRKSLSPRLITIPVHDECNKAFHLDEDYFVYTLAPLGLGSTSGNAMLGEMFGKFEAGEKEKLVYRVYKEFEERPSGIILPPGLVGKRIDSSRVSRVAWKIVRGLYFEHHNRIKLLPEGTPMGWNLYSPETRPPDTFFQALGREQSRGQNPDVFDYKLRVFPELSNFNYWAMLFWNKVIVIVWFHHPECDCEVCVETSTESV